MELAELENIEKELHTKSRDELLELAPKIYVDDAHKLSDEQLRHESYGNIIRLKDIKTMEKKYWEDMPLENLTKLLDDNNVSYSEEQLNKKSYDIIVKLETQMKIAELGNRISDVTFPKETQDYKNPEFKANCSVHDSQVYLDKMGPNPYAANSDEFRDFENVRISHQNNILVNDMGEEPLPLMKSNSDLRRMLSVDRDLETGELKIGKHFQKFLASLGQEHGYLRDNYRSRAEDIISLHNLQLSNAKKAKEEQYQLEKEFEKLKQVPLMVVNDEVTQEYKDWKKDMFSYRHKLQMKEKGFQTRDKVPGYLKKLIENYNSLVKKYIK